MSKDKLIGNIMFYVCLQSLTLSVPFELHKVKYSNVVAIFLVNHVQMTLILTAMRSRPFDLEEPYRGKAYKHIFFSLAITLQD